MPSFSVPLTLDYASAKFLLAAMDPQGVSMQGTSLDAAIDVAAKMFDQQERQHKVMLLLTDGEDHSRRRGKGCRKPANRG